MLNFFCEWSVIYSSYISLWRFKKPKHFIFRCPLSFLIWLDCLCHLPFSAHFTLTFTFVAHFINHEICIIIASATQSTRDGVFIYIGIFKVAVGEKRLFLQFNYCKNLYHQSQRENMKITVSSKVIKWHNENLFTLAPL